MPRRETQQPEIKSQQPRELNPRASIGSNEPPIDEALALEFKESLLEDHPDFILRVEEAVGGADRCKINNDTDLGKAGDLQRILRSMIKHINAKHELMKAPHLQKCVILDNQARIPRNQIQDAIAEVKSKMDAYARKKEQAEREKERQERERKAAEAAKAAEEAAQKQLTVDTATERPTEPVSSGPKTSRKSKRPVRGDAGSTVSTKDVWVANVVDYEAAFVFIEDNEKVREAIDYAIQKLVDFGKRKIPGVEITQTQETISR